MNKPLPRRKPQLTAAKLTLSDGYRRGPRGDGSGTYNPGGGGRVPSPSLKSLSVPHMLDKHKASQSFSSSSVNSIMNVGFGVGKTTKPLTPLAAAAGMGVAGVTKSSGKSSIFSEDESSEGSDGEKGEVVNTSKCVQLSKVEEVKQILPVPLPKGPLTPPPAKHEVPESSLHPCSKEGSATDATSANKSAGDDHRPDDRGPEEGSSKVKTVSGETKPCVVPPDLKVEEGKAIPFQPYRQGSPSPTEHKCEVVPKWDEVDKGDESRGSNVSVAELEERRREKEMELNREFDRLLFSTKSVKQGDQQQQQQPRTPTMPGEAVKPGEVSPNDAAKPSKVYESPKANRVYPSASPQASGSRQSSKACIPANTEVPTGAAAPCVKVFQTESTQDVKDINTHEKNKTKQEMPSWPDKQKDIVKSDEVCKDSLAEASCKKEPHRGHTGDAAPDRTSNKEVVTEQKFCKDSLFENLPSREVINGRNISGDYCVDKRGSKDSEGERNSSENHARRTHLKDTPAEKVPRNDVLPDTPPTKPVQEKKTKEGRAERGEKKSNEEGNDIKKNGAGMSGWRLSEHMEYDTNTTNTNKGTDAITKQENNHTKDHVDKKCKRDLNNTHKTIRNEVHIGDKPKQSRSSYINKRSTRDTSSDRKPNKDPSLEKKIKESPEDTHSIAEVLESRLDNTPKASKQNSEAVDDKKPYRDMPYINYCAKIKSSERKPVKNCSPEKKAGKVSPPERKAGKETGSECKSDVFTDHPKETPPARKPSKEASPEKKPNRNVPPDKKTHEPPSNNKKQSKAESKERKQKTEEGQSRKHSRESHGDRKPHRDTSSERSNNRDNTHKTTTNSDTNRESKPEREPVIEGSQERQEHHHHHHYHHHHHQRPTKEHTTKRNKEHHTTDKHHTAPPEKTNKDSSNEKRLKKDASNSEKHRREESSDRNQTKDSSLQSRYYNEPECERLPTVPSSGEKKPREPGYESRRVKNLDFIKKMAREHTLDSPYAVNNFLHKMSSKKQFMRDGSRKKGKGERSSEKHREKSASIPERSPVSENTLRKESGGDAPSPRDAPTKNKVTADKWDEVNDGSKFHKAKKLLTEKNGDSATPPRPPKLSLSPAESPKFKQRNKMSHSGETTLNTSTSSSSSSSTYSPSPGKSTKEGGMRAESYSPTSGRERERTDYQEKTDATRSPGDKNPCVRPTIADLVKGRERRKSTETDRYNGGEKGKRGDMYRDETSTDSETSEELNEKVDLDTEQTQTFSVSESNFNQVRECAVCVCLCVCCVCVCVCG